MQPVPSSLPNEEAATTTSANARQREAKKPQRGHRRRVEARSEAPSTLNPNFAAARQRETKKSQPNHRQRAKAQDGLQPVPSSLPPEEAATTTSSNARQRETKKSQPNHRQRAAARYERIATLIKLSRENAGQRPGPSLFYAH